MEFKFPKVVKIIGFSCLRANKNGLRHWQGKHVFVKEKKIKQTNDQKKSKSVKSLRYMDEIFSQLMTSHYMKIACYM